MIRLIATGVSNGDYSVSVGISIQFESQFVHYFMSSLTSCSLHVMPKLLHPLLYC